MTTYLAGVLLVVYAPTTLEFSLAFLNRHNSASRPTVYPLREHRTEQRVFIMRLKCGHRKNDKALIFNILKRLLWLYFCDRLNHMHTSPRTPINWPSECPQSYEVIPCSALLGRWCGDFVRWSLSTLILISAALMRSKYEISNTEKKRPVLSNCSTWKCKHLS